MLRIVSFFPTSWDLGPRQYLSGDKSGETRLTKTPAVLSADSSGSPTFVADAGYTQSDDGYLTAQLAMFVKLKKKKKERKEKKGSLWY